jgi:SAM-dependent methyltransferase
MRPRLDYDRHGRTYARHRRGDPRIAARIHAALGDAATVVNVGAGTGSYEPPDREVLAIEPAETMIAQRPPDAAPALVGVAEELPVEDTSVDAALSVLSIQHWDDVAKGLAEMRRVARRRIVLVTIEVEVLADLWLVRDYLPETLEYHAQAFPSIDRLLELLPHAEVEVLPVPSDCRDQFFAALWARPEACLDPNVRQGSSAWHQLAPGTLNRAIKRLAEDLESGRWDERYGQLRSSSSWDVGLRIVCAEVSGGKCAQHPSVRPDGVEFPRVEGQEPTGRDSSLIHGVVNANR